MRQKSIVFTLQQVKFTEKSHQLKRSLIEKVIKNYCLRVWSKRAFYFKTKWISSENSSVVCKNSESNIHRAFSETKKASFSTTASESRKHRFLKRLLTESLNSF